jgi:hypothetical protein
MRQLAVLCLVLTGAMNGAAWAADDIALLKNGNFAADAEGRPAEWTVRDSGQKISLDKQERPAAAEQSLRVDVTKDAGENYGEILQMVKIKPATAYRLQGDLRMTQARVGLYQIKLFKAGKEVARIPTDEAVVGCWQTLVKEFSSGDADSAAVLCRWRQNRTTVGQTVWFAGVKLTEIGPAAAVAKTPVAPVEPKVEAVPTFESIGLYWSLPEGSAAAAARVTYRPAGVAAWSEAQDLWFDGRALGGRPPEYRGSIVGLKPATKYEVRLSLAGTPIVKTIHVATWRETLPIARTVELPANSTTTLEIADVNGSADGFILYTGPSGGAARIDVGNKSPCNIRVTRSSYVIIRGLSLSGGQEHGIVLGRDENDDVHDIVIENNDISDWGANDESGFGVNHHSGVYSKSQKLERVVIQRNRIHSPRSNSNSWKQNREGRSEEDHPRGPQAISFMYGKGQYVVRYNELSGNASHHFNDAMGADRNFSYTGYPNRDSDIYGNYVAYCWDDGIEVEGANMNVRVWGNYITETYHPIATASVALGPLYIFRNVAHISRTGPKHTYGQSFMKVGGTRTRSGYFGDGRAYVLHNTILILPGTEPQVRGGITDGNRTLLNYVTRNNILQVPVPPRGGRPADLLFSISDKHKSDTNDFDYDLYNGQLAAVEGSEKHGIVDTPVYTNEVGFDLSTMTGRFSLAPNAPGSDAGAIVANFNDGHTGPAPDMGAHESGAPPMQFGVKAYLPVKPAGSGSK